MTAIALPSTFRPENFSMRLQTAQAAFASPFGGSEQVVDKINDRWMISLTIPRGASETLASIEAFVNAMRGMTNTCSLWHMQRRAPRGTMRGTPTCNTAAQGAASVVLIAAGAGATLLAGDMIGISTMLLQVSTDCTANGSGVITVPLVNRLRTAVTGGTAVVWDKPTAVFRLMSSPSVQYVPGYAEGVSLDFAEVVS